MEITFVNKSKAVQPQQTRDPSTDPARNISTEENKKYTIKNKVDSAEISASHNGSYEDKRLTIAKSAILYDVSVNKSTKQIDDLKKAIKSGSYNIPEDALADSILKE